MSARVSSEGQSATVRIQGQPYRLRTDSDLGHLEKVAGYVDRVLGEVRRNIPDSQDAAVLASLNIASDLLKLRESGRPDATSLITDERIQSLIELVDSV